VIWAHTRKRRPCKLSSTPASPSALPCGSTLPIVHKGSPVRTWGHTRDLCQCARRIEGQAAGRPRPDGAAAGDAAGKGSPTHHRLTARTITTTITASVAIPTSTSNEVTVIIRGAFSRVLIKPQLRRHFRLLFPVRPQRYCRPRRPHLPHFMRC
jgi:hypothetical protein